MFAYKHISIKDAFYQLLSEITAFYLVFPTLFFAYGWLKWPINFITLLLIMFFLAYTVKDMSQTSKYLWRNRQKHVYSRKTIGWIIASALLIILWLSFSGIGGIGYQNDDYRAKNALFNDLINQSFPLTATFSEVTTKIVYYYNYYLPPVAIGKLFGWKVANFFMFLWSFIGVAIAFAWFLIISQISLKGKAHKLLPLVLIFCLAGGLDFIGAYILKDLPFSWSRHIEFWVEYYQYSSNTTLIYWAPQHAIPAWLLTGMVVASIYKSQNLKYIGISLTASILWSPFAIIGIFPYLFALFFLYILSPQRKNLIFNPVANFFNAIAIWTGGIYLLYIASNNFSFPITVMWKVIENKRYFFATLLKFWFVEFGLLTFWATIYLVIHFLVYMTKNKKNSVSLWHNWLDALDENFNIKPNQFTITAMSVAVLIVLPFFKMGIFNDLVMRGSISALFIFWATISKILLDSNIQPYRQLRLDIGYFLVSVTLIIGFLTGYSEIVRSVENYQFGPPPSSAVSSLGNEDRLELVKQRAGRDNTFFYRYLGK